MRLYEWPLNYIFFPKLALIVHEAIINSVSEVLDLWMLARYVANCFSLSVCVLSTNCPVIEPMIFLLMPRIRQYQGMRGAVSVFGTWLRNVTTCVVEWYEINHLKYSHVKPGVRHTTGVNRYCNEATAFSERIVR